MTRQNLIGAWVGVEQSVIDDSIDQCRRYGILEFNVPLDTV